MKRVIVNKFTLRGGGMGGMKKCERLVELVYIEVLSWLNGRDTVRRGRGITVEPNSGVCSRPVMIVPVYTGTAQRMGEILWGRLVGGPCMLGTSIHDMCEAKGSFLFFFFFFFPTTLHCESFELPLSKVPKVPHGGVLGGGSRSEGDKEDRICGRQDHAWYGRTFPGKGRGNAKSGKEEEKIVKVLPIRCGFLRSIIQDSKGAY